MKEEEIIKGKKLIAEFMELEKHTHEINVPFWGKIPRLKAKTSVS